MEKINLTEKDEENLASLIPQAVALMPRHAQLGQYYRDTYLSPPSNLTAVVTVTIPLRDYMIMSAIVALMVSATMPKEKKEND